MHAVLLGALEGNAGAAHLRHAEGVVSLDAEHVLDALARILGVRLGTDHEGAELGVLAGIDSLFAHDFIQTGRIGRDGVHHGGAEVREKLELAEGVSSRGRDGQHAHLLSTVLKAKAAGEHPVAGGVLEHVLRAAAHHPQAAGDRIGPFIQILLRMQDDRGIAGGAAGGEGYLLEVIQRTDVRGCQTRLAETLLVERRIHAMLDGGFQPFELIGLYL